MFCYKTEHENMLFMNTLAVWHCLVIPHSTNTRNYVFYSRNNDKTTVLPCQTLDPTLTLL